VEKHGDHEGRRCQVYRRDDGARTLGARQGTGSEVRRLGGGPGGRGGRGRRFDVVLTSFGAEKIQVIKEIRAITGLGLKEAKDLVEGVPKPVKEGIAKAEADEIKKKLEAVGATVEIK